MIKLKWKKLGLIFCPNNNYDWMYSHASVPIAEHLNDDYYKIYFSSRDRNNRSFGGYVIINLNEPQKILEISKKPILSPGKIGTFDDSGTMLSWIVNYNNEKYLYYIGWNLTVTVPFRNSIGLAMLNNGEFHKMSEGPIMDRTFNEPYFCASSCVLIEDNKWKMWYLSCTGWKIVNNSPRHFYHIKYAESFDGINWNRDGKIAIDFKSEYEYAISRPCVLKENDRYKMWYSYRGTKKIDTYRIGYAESYNGIDWIRMDDLVGIDVSKEGWDSDMIEYPYVFNHNNKKYMLYNGNKYGKTGFGLAVLEE